MTVESVGVSGSRRRLLLLLTRHASAVSPTTMSVNVGALLRASAHSAVSVAIVSSVEMVARRCLTKRQVRVVPAPHVRTVVSYSKVRAPCMHDAGAWPVARGTAETDRRGGRRARAHWHRGPRTAASCDWVGHGYTV
eukprot:COSAG02_NODE_3991_length_5942_cov_5.521308_8_plen_136_part_01